MTSFEAGRPACTELAFFNANAGAIVMPLTLLDTPFAGLRHALHASPELSGDEAMFTLGSGEDCRPLHHPAFDFPDDLLDRATAIFSGLVDYHLA